MFILFYCGFSVLFAIVSTDFSIFICLEDQRCPSWATIGLGCRDQYMRWVCPQTCGTCTEVNNQCTNGCLSAGCQFHTYIVESYQCVCNKCGSTGGEPTKLPNPEDHTKEDSSKENEDSSKCTMTNRKATIAVFVSKQKRDNWIRDSRSGKTDNDLKEAIKNNLIPELNVFYKRDKLIHAEITFELVHAEIFTQEIDNELGEKIIPANELYVVEPFCEYITNRKINADIALYIIDQQEYDKLKAGGRAYYNGVCQKRENCAVITSAYWQPGVGYTKLVAHEIGHLFSFKDGPPAQCRQSIMYSPVNYNNWSKCETDIMYTRIVKNKYSFVCLPNACGEILTGLVSEADKIVLNGVCDQHYYAGYKYGAIHGIGEDPPPHHTDESKYNIYAKILNDNPNWFLQSRVCYGIPCIQLTRTISVNIGGVSGYQMSGKACGVNKKCKNILEGNTVVRASCE